MAQTTTATKPATTKRLTTEELRDAKKELATALTRGDDHHLTDYLDTLVRTAANARRAHGVFKRWSMSNQLTLESQRRRLAESHHGLYAGTAQWAKLGRLIRDDSRPKVIWAFAGTDEDDQQQQPGQPARHARARFVPVAVYDWTDTEYEDPSMIEPDWSVPLAAGDRATFDALVASAPTEVTILDQPSRAEHGLLTKDGITLYNASSTVGNQIETLAHELGHFHLDHLTRLAAASKGAERDEVRAVCEQEAQLVSWLTMKVLGLDEQVGNDVTVSTATYLRSWTDADTGEQIDGTKRRMKLLTQRLDVAMTAVDTIVEAYLAVANPTAQSSVAAV